LKQFSKKAVRRTGVDAQTLTLEKRLGEHNDPVCFSSKFTKRIPGPWFLVYKEAYPTRSEAFRRERWLKTGRGRDFLKSLPEVGC
jgi:putative endonuclease